MFATGGIRIRLGAVASGFLVEQECFWWQPNEEIAKVSTTHNY